MSDRKEKVLVCITIQKNSKRLIRQGAKLAKEIDAELHILHVEKGMSIFEQEDSIELLESLFELGKQLGGEVHFISDENVPNRIVAFIDEMDVTRLVLGQTMHNVIGKLLKKDINRKVINETKDIEVLILNRIKETPKMPTEKEIFSS